MEGESFGPAPPLHIISGYATDHNHNSASQWRIWGGGRWCDALFSLAVIYLGIIFHALIVSLLNRKIRLSRLVTVRVFCLFKSA